MVKRDSESMEEDDSRKDQGGRPFLSERYYDPPFRLIAYKKAFIHDKGWIWLDSGWRIRAPPRIRGPIRVRGGQLNTLYDIKLGLGLTDSEFYSLF